MLEEITGKFVFDIIGLSRESGLGPALHFFIYDMIKIVFLLLLITHLMGYVNSYFPVDKVKNYLNKRKMYGLENLIASFFGAVTPFCSCSSIPLFIGFVKGGIPLGITFSYLITSPLI
ncbi:MAG: permease, partial [Chlorobi bacterium]|nr:permease [Chlorobiota bacterium]